MKTLARNIPTFVFAGVGVYLLLHGHPTAGGWALFASVLMAGWHD